MEYFQNNEPSSAPSFNEFEIPELNSKSEMESKSTPIHSATQQFAVCDTDLSSKENSRSSTYDSEINGNTFDSSSKPEATIMNASVLSMSTSITNTNSHDSTSLEPQNTKTESALSSHDDIRVPVEKSSTYRAPIAENLPVIIPDDVLEQCGDWEFIVELLQDMIADKDNVIQEMQDAIVNSDHVKYYRTAHALKGAALNMHMPALSHYSKAAELLGKDLEKDPDDVRKLSERQFYVDQLLIQYKRLEDFIPEAQKLADEEMQVKQER